MQTFVPYTNTRKTAKALDYRRLGKQRVECLQILRTLAGIKKGWSNHPATVMWRDYPQALIAYGMVICQEWIARGYKDTCLEKILGFSERFQGLGAPFVIPTWWGGPIHSTHRAALLNKDFDYYSRFGWDEIPAAQYYWPGE